jgi:hypothetical protein
MILSCIRMTQSFSVTSLYIPHLNQGVPTMKITATEEPVFVAQSRGVVSDNLLVPVASNVEQLKHKELPPVLQHITNERAEFQLQLGKAMDTIRSDMPDILWRKPGTSLTC